MINESVHELIDNIDMILEKKSKEKFEDIKRKLAWKIQKMQTQGAPKLRKKYNIKDARSRSKFYEEADFFKERTPS